MQSALLDVPDAGFAKIWQVGCDIERELHAANAEIERLTNKVAQLYEGAEEAKQRIKRMEEDLIDAKNQYAVLVADVVLYEDRGERIKRLEEAGDRAIENSYYPDRVKVWHKAKEAKL
jgi:predicted  nucleic acid-binding Zn-ribbon protein